LADQAGAPVVRAAGGVVWRNGQASGGEPAVEVAIIHRPRYDDWSIPKGKLVPGESDLEGAIREIAEETGYRVRIGRPLGEVSYPKKMGNEERLKVVRYWSMYAEGGLFSPTPEVDQLRWVSLEEALQALSHERDRELLKNFASVPALTRSVLLVRHASAGNRSGWNGDDRQRPLDPLGKAQSEGLIWLLTRFDVREIVSADLARCVMTVEPLSAAVGLTIREEPVFSEEGYPGRESEAVSLLRQLASDNTAAVACSQGGVVPDLVQRLSLEDGVELETPVPSKKGSVWSLTFAGERLIAAEYFPPLQS
jgi:8-oxo-dGTP pyrophosphatase MutT (NUDIX family)/phosphohistidine phosphatase SixA